jgi:hypothetical protein
MDEKLQPVPPSMFDLGHQGDFDYTQIDHMLSLTPTQRLDKHEGWRLFVKEALENARLRTEKGSTQSSE